MTESISDNTYRSAQPLLPDIDELFRAVEQEIDQEKPPAYVASSAAPGTPDSDRSAPYVRAAAVLSTFDPETLQPLTDPQTPPMAADPTHSDHPVRHLLGHSTMVVDARGEVRWCLRDPVRRAALAELLAAGRIRGALDANPAIALDKIDPVQRILSAVLLGSLPPVRELRLEELTTLQRIAPWMEKLELRAPFPPAQEIRRYLERERLLDPFRHLIGGWEGGIFVEHFRGRQRELRRLREYVDVAESESLLESAVRAVAGVVGFLLNLHERPPLVIHGPGGVGKSTLMAKFLLQHAEAREEEPFPFVYIDFDRPDMLAAGPHTLLAEVARQLAVQYPYAEGALLDFRRRLQDNTASHDALSPIPDISPFLSIYNQYMEPNRPLLLVFDTFEEVQQRSRDYVLGVFHFLDRLQGAVPRLRTVLVGRAPVTEEEVGFRAENLPLPDLDAEAARGFLQSRGIRDEQVATEIIGLIGGQPLALKLAADLVRERSIAEVREAAGGTGVIAWLRRSWAQTDVTVRLYQRLLHHITDPEVRKLAHPGLVLRRITPLIIREVLAEPCGLEVEDAVAAQRLFERLRNQVSLVVPAEPGVLRHRPDVRRMMLPLILEDKPEQARWIQERAVAYYQQWTGTTAERAEEVYHRFMLGESPRSVARRWNAGLDAYLFPALDELPPRAQAFVAARIKAERPDAVWREADLEDWEIYAERRVRDLLEMRKPEQAAEVLRQRSERSDSSRLYGLEPLVLHAMGRRDEARAAARGALERFRRTGADPDIIFDLEGLLQIDPK
jgi:hypothetical protein